MLYLLVKTCTRILIGLEMKLLCSSQMILYQVSLISEIKELNKLAHTTFVDQIEHARVKIVEISSRSCSLCSLHVNDDAYLTCDNHCALLDVNFFNLVLFAHHAFKSGK